MSPVNAGGRTVGYVDGKNVFGPGGNGDFRGCVDGDTIRGSNRREIKGYVDGCHVHKPGLMGRGERMGTVCGNDVQNSRSASVCTIRGWDSDQVKGAAALLLGLLD